MGPVVSGEAPPAVRRLIMRQTAVNLCILRGNRDNRLMAAEQTGQDDKGPSIQPRFLGLEDVATYLNVSTTQVYALVRSGELPAIKLGGRGVCRVDRNKLDAFLDDLETKTAEWAKAHPLNPRAGAVPEEEK